VNFSFSEEQEALRQAVSRFLAENWPMSEVRRLMETADGYDPAIWPQLSKGLGLAGLIVPEEYGGSGGSFADLMIVLEEMGRTLSGGPFFATAALASSAILAVGDDAAKRELLPAIAAGEALATLAFAEDRGGWQTGEIRAQAVAAGNHFMLNGDKTAVVDGAIADIVLVAARLGERLAIFVVRGGAEGLTRMPLATLDPTRKQARLEFRDTPAVLLAAPDNAEGAVAKVLDLAAVALAAEQVGGAQQCLDMSVGYAWTRSQFGRPIGSFQAIKHKCADVFLAVESARSAAYYAGWIAAEDTGELPVVASLAKSYCSEAFFLAAAENIQIHGGIGFTWEHDAHLFFKRAKAMEIWLGDPQYHRELLAERIGI
jgi:alkylation response protein AidB-like acyl-CoA dehydrogenase